VLTQEQLQTAYDARVVEVAEYQLNIDNFIRAIAKIDEEHNDNTDMQEFKQHLTKLLSDNQREQLKSIIMRDVLADQLAELNANILP
jgi:uncharacterized tellurite resistance protein B-like protein